MVELPWELEEKILSLTTAKSLTRFRSVCKRWNTLFKDELFVNDHLSRSRPQFILLVESKICIVDVNLDGQSIEVHDLPQFDPGYGVLCDTKVECCDGLLMFSTTRGTGICNPWLRLIRWNESILDKPSGIGYDNSTPDKQYKIFSSCSSYTTTLHANIIEIGSDASKSKTYEFAMEFYSRSSVSLNGTLYWIAYSRVCYEHCIQTFEFSTERFEFYCNLPTKRS
ncbi:jacalin-related lectin 38-like, partial [Raphanus sativus]|uniref:Jacalin-related lectin 38-like n=1 Tax=Raphanus sativus TaxID=3726 RepID=A0A9W3D3N8_RAPSA